ncbi:hypothetical protein COY28_02040, partial [Candidatus Woesearchaeota archaeon CG_4_10_14_0_2_um_filter_57_5]
PSLVLHGPTAVLQARHFERSVQGYFPKATVHYSVKANPELVGALAETNVCFMVTDERQLDRVLSVAAADKVTMLAQAYTRDMIVAAASRGVTRFIADSASQASLLAEVAPQATILCRMSSTVGGTYRSHASLGMPLKECVDALRSLHSKDVKVGLHCHSFSQNNNLPKWREHFGFVLSAMAAVRAAKVSLAVIDTGGGYPVSYDEQALSLESIFRGSQDIIKQLVDESAGAEIAFEPGRFIAAPAGIVLMRVIATKPGVATVDFSCYSGCMDAILVRQYLPVLKVLADGAVAPFADEGVVLRGKLPDSLDILHPSARVAAKEGDLLLMGNAGAYAFSTDFGPSCMVVVKE